MPANFFDSLGHHTCDCKTSSAIGKLNQSRNVTISPNPVINSWFDVQATSPVSSVEVVSVVGQQVYYREYAVRQRDVRVVLNNLPDGIYLVRVRFDSSEPVIRKIIVR
jgi:hypothetical protein